MDDDKQAIVVGLAAGLGGFAGLLIVCCICWQILCGSWVEKKDVKSKGGPIPVKNQRHLTTATKIQTNVSTVTPMRSTNIYADLKSDASSDLASKLKPTRR